MNSIKRLKNKLIMRGAKINPPASKNAISLLVQASPIPVTAELVNIFLEFDGFENFSMDPKSNISFWSIDRVINGLDSRARINKYLPIADFFISSELICLNEDHVFWADRNTAIASDVYSFLSNLAAGGYDS